MDREKVIVFLAVAKSIFETKTIPETYIILKIISINITWYQNSVLVVFFFFFISVRCKHVLTLLNYLKNFCVHSQKDLQCQLYLLLDT